MRDEDKGAGTTARDVAAIPERPSYQERRAAYEAGADMTAKVADPRELERDRDKREAFEAVGRILDTRRMEWELGIGKVLRRGHAFADALGMALGNVSRDEAIDALKRELGEQLERLRVGML